MVIGVGVRRFEKQYEITRDENGCGDEEAALEKAGIKDINPFCGRGSEERQRLVYTGYLRECTDNDVREVAAYLLERRARGKS